jgi:hypothetical protein
MPSRCDLLDGPVVRAPHRALGAASAMLVLRLCASIIAIVLALAGPAVAGDRVKHSGSIVSIADDGATFVLAEVGPWRVRAGATVLTYRTITLMPTTEFTIVARAYAAPSGLAGDFVEVQIESGGIYLDDYVTVDCQHEGRRLVALKITVTELPIEEIGVGSVR